ncbi:uncharacterized protein LOC135214991 [Macrobrachium nipponense]|uniref:uncharacterized protein LOC135214991 n=1 Tax=Macrobrachium nipponense TaxID=159736 RepID=UPI0030C7E171
MNITVQQAFPMIRNVHWLRVKSQHYGRQIRYFGACCSIGKYNLQKKMSLPVTPQTTSSALILMQYPDVASIGNSMYSSVTGSEMTEKEVKRAVDDISEKFAEAMELMNDARSSLGTVYFSEDVLDTQAQVKETLDDYTSLLSKLNEKQKRTVIQSIGLKMEELKAQMSLLEDLAKE